jgi:transposase
MSLSVDLRKRVMAAIDDGMRPTEAERVFKVSRSAIYDWFTLRAETNSLEPKSGYQKGHSHSITDWEKFRAFVEINKHRTVKAMIIEWEKLTGDKVTESPMERALKKIGYTSKKKLLVTPKPTPKNVKHF